MGLAVARRCLGDGARVVIAGRSPAGNHAPGVDLPVSAAARSGRHSSTRTSPNQGQSSAKEFRCERGSKEHPFGIMHFLFLARLRPHEYEQMMVILVVRLGRTWMGRGSEHGIGVVLPSLFASATDGVRPDTL
ncbi:hypothetical protein EAS64_02880 [Trebonia kvetii]|uniref:Uncharacterized protein n=1 Tax=Trebonia kvetii TaxID=2480626 RepID=A0A6P2C7B5_9ACTN|nr:hypothetical protein EAS64_02880 [Trebonia kvetii]